MAYRLNICFNMYELLCDVAVTACHCSFLLSVLFSLFSVHAVLPFLSE